MELAKNKGTWIGEELTLSSDAKITLNIEPANDIIINGINKGKTNEQTEYTFDKMCSKNTILIKKWNIIYTINIFIVLPHSSVA